MSSSMALRRSPKPGALTAQTWSVPRSLFTTSVARASPSTSSAMIEQRLAALGDLLEQREQVLDGADLLLVDEDVGVVELGLHAPPASVDEVRREVAACRTACPRRRRASVSMVLASSTVMTPSLPTFSIASAMIWPMVSSPVGGDGGRPARSRRCPSTFLADACRARRRWRSTALSMPRCRAVGLAPAVTFLRPSRVDGLGEDGGGGGAVAGDVAGLGGDLTDHLGAHVLEGVLELDLLGDADAVLGDRRGCRISCRG